MSTGQKIKKYRKLRKMTQKSLGESVGMVESAIRNYERDIRMPSEEVLGKLADSLGVPVAALEDYEIGTAREALEALFRLEDAFGLTPTDEGTLGFDPKAKGAQKLSQTVKAWRGVLDDVAAGEMTTEEYELWKASLKS